MDNSDSVLAEVIQTPEVKFTAAITPEMLIEVAVAREERRLDGVIAGLRKQLGPLRATLEKAKAAMIAVPSLKKADPHPSITALATLLKEIKFDGGDRDFKVSAAAEITDKGTVQVVTNIHLDGSYHNRSKTVERGMNPAEKKAHRGMREAQACVTEVEKALIAAEKELQEWSSGKRKRALGAQVTEGLMGKTKEGREMLGLVSQKMLNA